MIDPNQIRAAAHVGLSIAQVAERLGYSPRHIERVAQQYGIGFDPLDMDEESEHEAWAVMANLRVGVTEIAWCHCVSRQTVYTHLSHNPTKQRT
jgi:predicted short-subunit dehydrogenase-like oxidoreductase (DUF2520 family)